MRALVYLAGALALSFVAAPGRAGQDDPSAPLAFEALFGGPFSLVDGEGRRRTDADFHGHFVLVTFGYTWCPDICPATLQEIEAALAILGPEGDELKALFVSLDHGRDTPEIVSDYVAHFGTRIAGLTGTEAEIDAVARAYRVHRVKVVPEWSQGTDDYLIDHSSLTFLIGPDGRVATLFPHATSAEAMAKTVRTYIRGQQ